MVLYTDNTAAAVHSLKILRQLQAEVAAPPHPQTMDAAAEGYRLLYTADLLRHTGAVTSEEVDSSIGKPLARAIQQGFSAAGYDERQIKVRYSLERTELNMGTSPRLEFQLDTTLERPELLAAIAKAEPHVLAAANTLDSTGFSKLATAVAR